METRPDPATGAPVIARVTGDKLHPTNFGRLCTKGATHAEMMAATDGRLTTALVRPARGEEPVPTPVDDAVADAGNRLRAIIDEHGPDAVAFYVVCAFVTWFVFLRLQEHRAHAGENIGRTPAPVPVG